MTARRTPSAGRRALLLHCTLALVVLVSSVCEAPAFAQGVPRDLPDRTEFVAAKLRTLPAGAEASVMRPRFVKLGFQIGYLGRLYASCETNDFHCDKEIDRYALQMVAAHTDVSEPPVFEKVRVAVLPDHFATVVKSPISKQDLQSQVIPFIANLVGMPVLDTPDRLRMMGPADNATLGLTKEEVFDLGLANLRRTLAPLMQVAKPALGAQIGRLDGHPYMTSRMLLVETWAPLAAAQGGVLIVATPTLDALLYVGEASPATLDALSAETHRLIGLSPNRALTATLFRWYPTGWKVIEKP